MAKEQQASLVGPLEVVEYEHHGLVLRHHSQQADHGGKEEEPFSVGVGRLQGGKSRMRLAKAGTSRDSSEPWALTWARSWSSEV